MGMSINDCIFHLFPILCVFPRYTLLVSDDLFTLATKSQSIGSSIYCIFLSTLSGLAELKKGRADTGIANSNTESLTFSIG